MDSERWKKISAIYHQASELEGEARNRFLADTCNTDDDLRSEVEALLAVSVDAASGIERAVETAAADYADSLGQIENIGPYRLLSVIGHGGMGQVFLAERADQEFQREVAIKIIPWMTATPALIERFRQERQILANLDHPNIARMLDGGSSDGDMPYLVMEFVAGQNIIEYCQENRLSLRQKLDLFLQICDAVQYAHRKLIIHRDVKPSNILITAEGSPKLLDFGIARLLDADAAVTHADMRFMTRQYASPELVRGEAASTSTDIYGLGLLLYELLTDRFPYPVEGSTSVEIEHLILETEPVVPSLAVANGSSGIPNLKGDLDNIVMMALRKEPERRYQSVKDLADDVQNFLAHRPVIARTATYRYRTGKFIYRHRLGVVALTTTILAAITMTAFYTVQLAAERDIAEQQRRVAETTTEFMVGLFENNAPAQALGKDLTARDVLDRGAKKLAGELQDTPPVRARLLLTLGRVYERLGLYAPAREYLEQSIELYRNEVPDAEEITIENLEELAWIYYRSEDWDKAASAANEALERRETRVGTRDPSLAKVLNLLGTIAYWRDNFDASLTHYHRALALLDGNNDESRALRAKTLNHLGIVYDILDQDAEAEAAYLASYQIRMDLHGENHPDTGTAAANLGSYYFNVKDLDKAAEYAVNALSIDRAMHGNEHADVAFDLNLLARIEQERDNFAASLEYDEEALEIWGRTVGETHSRYVVALDNIATTHIELVDYETALRFATRAYNISHAENGERHTITADTLYTSGRALRGLDRLDDARDVLLRAADIRLEELGAQNSAYWDVQQLLSLVEHEAGDSASAEQLIAATLDYVETNRPEDQGRMIIVLDRYIAILKIAGDDNAKLEELILRRAEYP